LRTQEITKEEVPEKYINLGGRSLTSRIIADEVNPTCDPLKRHNKLVFAPGLMAGISASSVHRLSLGGKSPLTGGIKESNSGGIFALKMARMNIKAIILEDELHNNEKKVLYIGKDYEFQFINADKYMGLDTLSAGESINKDLGGNLAIALIGPAGETKMLCASVVVSDKDGVVSRHLGRGGLGAVMGAKGLKALVLNDKDYERVEVVDKIALKDSVKAYTNALRNIYKIWHKCDG